MYRHGNMAKASICSVKKMEWRCPSLRMPRHKKSMRHGCKRWCRGSCRTQVIRMADLQAVAVTAGPGSYGRACALEWPLPKGFCYALNILPLIAEDTLKVMAFCCPGNKLAGHRSYCARMIDARRMEVFTALYGHDMTPLLPSTAMVIDENSLFCLVT